MEGWHSCCFYPYSKARLRLFRFVWKCVISSVPLRNKRLYRPVTMKLPYASVKKKNLCYFYWKTYKIFDVWWFRTYLTTYGLNPKGWQWLILQAISTHSQKKYKICHFSHVLGSYGEPPEKSLCSWAQTTRRVCMQHICFSLVSIFALVTLKERKNIFGAKKLVLL